MRERGSRCAVPTRISRPTSRVQGCADGRKGDRQAIRRMPGRSRKTSSASATTRQTCWNRPEAGQIDPWKAVGAVSFSVQKGGGDPQMFGFNAECTGQRPQRGALLQCCNR